MCNGKIIKENKFFYEPGGPEFDQYVVGDDNCQGCPHRTVPYEFISQSISNPSNDYGCRGLTGFMGNSIELRG